LNMQALQPSSITNPSPTNADADSHRSNANSDGKHHVHHVHISNQAIDEHADIENYERADMDAQVHHRNMKFGPKSPRAHHKAADRLSDRSSFSFTDVLDTLRNRPAKVSVTNQDDHTDRHTGGHTGTDAGRHTGTHTDRHTGRQAAEQGDGDVEMEALGEKDLTSCIHTSIPQDDAVSAGTRT
jgi:hypothetical protein